MATRGGRPPRGGRGRQRSRSANPYGHDGQGEGRGRGGQGGWRGQDQGQGRGRGQGEGRGRGGQGGGRGQDQGRGRGRGRGRRWDDTTDYNSMINTHSVKQFVTSRLFRANVLSPNNFLVLVSRSLDIEKSDKVIRHQFLIRLTQSPFLEMNGPILGTIQDVLRPSDNRSLREKTDMLNGFLKLLDLLEEMMTRIPDCRNTRPYTSTTISMMTMVPFLNDELKSRIEEVKSQLSDPTQLEARINDPSHNWSPNVSFIAEPIIPESLEKLLNEELDKCFINPIKGAYKSPAHYLETWYRMMREDFMGPLRGAIKDFKTTFKANDKLRKRIRVDGGYHYTLEKILDRDKLEGEYYCLIQFSTEELKHVNWEHTDRLRFDSIMVLSDDHYQTARYAVITGHDKKRAKHGQVWLKMIGGPLAMDRNFRGIEPMAFYEPYRCVLERLKILAARVHDNQTLPMSRYLVDVNKSVRQPDYMKNDSHLELASGGVTQTQFPNLDDEGLDFSQKEALKLALTHEIALIQGPPGTGKSYVGAMFVCIMMLNKHLWQRHDRGRMLLLAYKNHAIDQFIGECERMGMDMSTTVRVGSRSDISMDKYQLRNKRKQLKDLHEYSGLNNVMRDLRQELVEAEKMITMSERVVKTRNREMRYADYQHYLPGKFLYQFNHVFQTNRSQHMEQVVFEWMAGDIRAVAMTMDTIDREEPMQYTTAEEIYYAYDRFDEIPLEWRRQLYAFWCESARDEAEQCLVGCRDWHEQLTNQLNQMRRRQDIAVVHRSDIVAMTTTGASKHGYLLDAANPCIVLVEEAAEVLETHIVAPLTKGCKHVVLIGDHQQLRPQVSNFAMEKKNLTISLFERLITNEVPSRRLQIQHRMHPEIASLLVPHIYSSLENHDTVLDYPLVRGLRKRMHFFHHDHPEERIGEKSSCRNAFEADYVVGLCHYLLLQDYEPTDITILSTYMGQMRLIKQKMQSFCKEHPQPLYTEYEKQQMLEREFEDYLDQKMAIQCGDRKMRDMDNKTRSWYNRRAEEYKTKKERLEGARSKMQDVRVTTVDNYQGEECTIILLSFVRSNPVCNIGFLKWPNRICVALSRAKHGFYAVGDFKLFAKNTKSDLWKKLCAQMLYEDAQPSESDRVQRPDPNLSAKLELQCVNHKSIRELQDPCKFLELAPEGGCLRPCQFRLKCGHTCTRLCHHLDASHVQFTCKKNCEGFLDCDHLCQRRCDKDGDDKRFFTVQNFKGKFRNCLSCSKNIRCEVEVTMRPSCGHTGTTECSNKPIYACQTRVEFTLDCSHKTLQPCSTDKREIKCMTLVQEVLEECGHEVKRRCHNKNPQCKKLIQRLLSCGIHRKEMYCHERNEPVSCNTEVEINPTCGHTRTAKCCKKLEESLKSCEVLVPKKLKCGHTKEVQCSLISLEHQCSEKVEMQLPCRHSKTLPCTEVEEIKKRPTTLMSKIKCSERVQFKLTCGHEIERICSDKVTKLCEKIRTEMLKCGHQVKGKCHEFERIKKEGCREKVEVTVPCGHKVNIDCGGDIKDLPYVRCEKHCLIHCVHTRCIKECNKPCTPCIEPCPNECPHRKCTRACHQECDRQPCNQPCAKIKTCGHVCGGICGELCPTGCTICRPNARKGRRIRILPCHHDFSPAQLDKHMKVREDERVQEVVSKFCPLSRCGAVISQCPRYANQIRRYQQVTKLREYTTESTWWYCKKGGHFVKTSKQGGIDTASRHLCTMHRGLNVQIQYEQYERHRAAEERSQNEDDDRPDHRPADLKNNAFFMKVAGTDRFAGRGIGRGGRGLTPQEIYRPFFGENTRPRNDGGMFRNLAREPLEGRSPPRRAQSVAELDRMIDETDRMNLDDTDAESMNVSDSDSDESVHDDLHRWIYDLY